MPRGLRVGIIFQRKQKNHTRPSCKMRRPKSYKSSINLFKKKEKKKKNKKNIQCFNRSEAAKSSGKSLHPHGFVTCLRNNVCMEELCGNENHRQSDANNRQSHTCRRHPRLNECILPRIQMTRSGGNAHQKKTDKPPWPCSRHPSTEKNKNKNKNKKLKLFLSFLNLAKHQ